METRAKKPLFSIKNLKKYFPLKKKAFQRRQFYVHANENISLDIFEGETLGLVGESGSGKSTFGRTILQIYEQTEGVTLYYGSTIAEVNPAYVRKDLKNIKNLFNDYQKEMDEYAILEEKIKSKETAANADLDSDEYHAIVDTMMQKRRKIQNDYYNVLRLAGGLLVDDNLDDVSKLLSEQFEARVEEAKVRKEIADIDWKLNEYKDESSKEKLRKRRTEVESKLSGLHAEVEKKEAAVLARRESLKGTEGYDEFEALRDDGVDLARLSEREMRELRKNMQIIFQDPYSSLNTRMTLGNIIGEGLIAHNMFKSRKSEGYNSYIQGVMEECGLAPYFIHRYPHQFSGGQRQRIGIARALALKPKFIVCDEAVSALDVSIQSQVINLLQDLKEENNLTYLFITHDLSVVKYISDRIAVMYLGMVVELADSDKMFETPLHPYTQALLAAIPRTDVEGNQELAILEGDIPSAVNPPDGCRFHTRCRYCMERCTQYEPDLQEVGSEHFVACHLYDLEEEERKTWVAECDEKERQRLEELDQISKEVSRELIKEDQEHQDEDLVKDTK